MKKYLIIIAMIYPFASVAENIVFPPNSGLVNLKHAPYNAKGDGLTDDTAAIIQAIEDNIGYRPRRTLYFPNGTYLVSDRLAWKNAEGEWKCYLSFQGQSRDQTIIKLKEGAEGYDDIENPKAVVYTASTFFSTSADPNNVGAGNEAYGNYIQNLTIDTGGNLGAIGIDYMANNVGAIREVKIVGNGLVGLSMQRYGPGPCLIKDVEIDGFDYGIKVAHRDYGITFEHITLRNQKVVGIYNGGNVLSMRGLTSHNSVTVIDNAGLNGLVVLIKGIFDGGSAEKIAIINKGGLYVRDINAAGYKAAIEHDGIELPGAIIKEYASDINSLFPSPQSALNLPIEEVPVLPEDPLSEWANVVDYGADSKDRYNDDTQAIQDAIDSGKSTVFLPAGFYVVTRPILVRGKARRIFSKGALISVAWHHEFDDPNNPKAIFEVLDGYYETVEIAGVSSWNGYSDPARPTFYSVGINHATKRNLVLRDMSWNTYNNSAISGSVFFENVLMEYLHFNYPQQIWARQLDLEGFETKIVNNGADLWILGLKTENPSIVIETRGKGKTELLGALIYPVASVNSEMPAFNNTDSFHSLSYATTSYKDGGDYAIQIKENVNGDNRALHKSNVRQRGAGSMIPLVVYKEALPRPKNLKILNTQ